MTRREEVTLACLPLSIESAAAFDDDVYGYCGKCGTPIRWRPHATADHRWCAPCVIGSLKPGDRLAVTQRTLEEAQAFVAAQAVADDLKRGGSR